MYRWYIIEENMQSHSTQQDSRLPRTALPWLIWSIGTVFVVFQFLLQLSSGVMVERLMNAFTMSAFAAGLMSGAYYYIYVALQTPAGMLIDRYGARELLSGGGIVCALGCFLFAASTTVWVADLARVLMGGGSAFAYVGMIYLVTKWFPARHFGLMIGLSDFVATFVTVGCNVYLATLLEKMSWRISMVFAGIIATLIGIFAYIIIRNRATSVANTKPQQRLTFSEQAKIVTKDPVLWLNGVYVGIIFAIMAVFSGMWGIPFIEVQLGVSNATATLLASMIYVGTAIACPIAGWIYPHVRQHLRQIFFGAPLLICITFVWLIYWPPTSLVLFAVLMIFVGAFSCVYVLCYTYVNDIAQDNVKTTAIGFTNSLCVVTVPILQPLVGYLLQFSHAAGVVAGKGTYDAADYQFALAVLPITLIIASGLSLFIFKSTPEPMLAKSVS